MNNFKVIYLVCLLAFSTGFISCESKNSTGPKDIVTVNVFVEDDTGKPISGAHITTSPGEYEVVTDLEGKAVFGNIPVDKYMFYITRTGYDMISHAVKIDNNDLQDIILVVDSHPPVVKIFFLQPDKFISRYNYRFTGEGTDSEDGILPDSSLVWYSNIDGELGNGKDILVELLTPGNHTITFEGVDSSQKKNTTTINISVGDYYSNSFFPNPDGAEWQYQHEDEIFNTVSEEGVSEAWELSRINVIVEDNTRISRMDYKVRSSKYIKEYHYTISDELEMEDGNVYVKKTTEKLQVIQEGWGDDTVNIETTYDPRYILLKNEINPGDENYYSNTVRANVKWVYNDPIHGQLEFPESFNVTTEINIGDMVTINTDIGKLDCIQVTITEGASVRKWWLASGIGIIMLQHNAFDSPPLASINKTNLSNSNVTGAKIASSTKSAAGYAFYEPLQSNAGSMSAGDSPERLKKICEMLRMLAPR
ncbi:MAG: carboxypeptidase regulatory-like domain-containing protein [Candidatus Latescibacteria bacterium]|nr:carboxypeptidase regulatory-like domain-containing protein [Candidatus Latescibacterota bacterium]